MAEIQPGRTNLPQACRRAGTFQFDIRSLLIVVTAAGLATWAWQQGLIFTVTAPTIVLITALLAAGAATMTAWRSQPEATGDDLGPDRRSREEISRGLFGMVPTVAALTFVFLFDLGGDGPGNKALIAVLWFLGLTIYLIAVVELLVLLVDPPDRPRNRPLRTLLGIALVSNFVLLPWFFIAIAVGILAQA